MTLTALSKHRFKNLLGILLLVGGCTDDPTAVTPPQTLPPPDPPVQLPNLPQPTPSPTPTDDLSPLSPKVVYSAGWQEMVITANSAKTTVTIGAHFATSRNACGREAYGAIDLDLWNQLAKNVNAAIAQTSPRAEEYCVDPPTDTYRYMDGTVDIKLATGSQTFYEIKNGQICSIIQDTAVSDALLAAINQLIVAADKEDCPNGWGS